MKQSKLIQLLSQLRPREIEQFDELLQTSFFSTKTETDQLWAYLKPRCGKWSKLDQELDKDKIQRSLFGDQASSNKSLRNTMSELTRHLEFFLIMGLLKQESLPRKKLTIKALERRKLYEQFALATQNLIRWHPEAGLRSSSYHLDLMDLHHHYFFHPSTEKQDPKIDDIQRAMGHLDAFFVLRKLRYCCELLNRHYILGEEYQIELLDEVQALATKQLSEETPLVYIYLDLIQIFLHGYSDQNYQRIKERLIHSTLRDDEQQTVLYYLININTRQINQVGSPEVIREGLELYQIGIDREILVRNKEITYVTYLNVANKGSVIGEFEWTRDFIEKYRKFLPKAWQKDAYKAALATYHFHRGEYEEVPSIMSDLKFPPTTYTLMLRCVLLRSLYELAMLNQSYQSLFDAELENLYRYLKYHEYMREEAKAAYERFRRFTNKLAGIRRKGPIDEQRRADLHQQLREQYPIAVPRWLHQKIDEL
ncbi:MAG: hypothetical protein AAFW73_07515 [Bacteroidota bacterium]